MDNTLPMFLRVWHFGLLFIFSVFLECIPSSLPAQIHGSKVDSLKRELSKTKGNERFAVLSKLFDETSNTNFKEALEFATQYRELADSSGDSLKIVLGGRMQAYSLMDFGRNEEVLSILTKILGIAKRNQDKYPELKKMIKVFLNNSGLAYLYLGNYDKALEMQYQSLEIREREGDKRSMRSTLNNIGLVYYNIKDFDRAIEFYLKGYQLCKELNDFTGQERLFLNLGLAYASLDKYDQAISSYFDAFNICKENCGDNTKKEGLLDLGFAYLGMGQYDKARKNFQASLEISRKQSDVRFTAEGLFGLGRLELKLNNPKQAVVYLTEAENKIQHARLAYTRISTYKFLAFAYGELKENQKASLYQAKYTQIKDSIYSDRLIKNMNDLTNSMDKDRILASSTKQSTNRLHDRQQENFSISLLLVGWITVVATTVLSVFLHLLSNRQKRINVELSETKILIQQHQSNTKSHDSAQTFTEEVLFTERLSEFLIKLRHGARFYKTSSPFTSDELNDLRKLLGEPLSLNL